MILTLDTPLLSGKPVDLKPGQFYNAIMERPSPPPAYQEDTLRRIDESIRTCAELTGIRASIVAGQIIHETAALRFGNQVKPDQYNFAGVGATNDGKTGLTNATPHQGVLLVFIHHLAYIYGRIDRWPQHLRQYAGFDPRVKNVLDAGHGGTVKVIGDYTNGRWAWSPRYKDGRPMPNGVLDNGYAYGLRDVGNYVLSKPGYATPPVKEEPMALSIREAIIPASNENRPGLPMAPIYITVHETANTSPGANAEMHRAFLENGGGAEGVSFHWVVDDTEAVHLIPDNEVAWHAGDGYDGVGNRQSVAIETAVNGDGNWKKTLEHLAQLVRLLMERHKIPVERVVPHRNWSGKNCPTKLLGNNSAQWNTLIQGLTATPAAPAVTTATDTITKTETYTFPETGKTVSGRFLQYWRGAGDQALTIFGLPLTEAYNDGASGLLVQYFERARLEYHPQNPEPYTVQLGRVGAELMAELNIPFS